MFKNIMTSFLFLLISYGAYAVSEKTCLFSGMTGVIHYEGKPAVNVRLLRKVEGKVQDETVTDEKGYFEFKPVYQKKSLFNVLPMEFAIQQQILAYKETTEYELWTGVKRKEQDNAESRGKPLVVSCELNLEDEHHIRVNGSIFFSLCTWDVEGDPTLDYGTGLDE